MTNCEHWFHIIVTWHKKTTSTINYTSTSTVSATTTYITSCYTTSSSTQLSRPFTRPADISCGTDHNLKYRDSPPFTSSDTEESIIKSSLDNVSDDIVLMSCTLSMGCRLCQNWFTFNTHYSLNKLWFTK